MDLGGGARNLRIAGTGRYDPCNIVTLCDGEALDVAGFLALEKSAALLVGFYAANRSDMLGISGYVSVAGTLVLNPQSALSAFSNANSSDSVTAGDTLTGGNSAAEITDNLPDLQTLATVICTDRLRSRLSGDGTPPDPGDRVEPGDAVDPMNPVGPARAQSEKIVEPSPSHAVVGFSTDSAQHLRDCSVNVSPT